VVLVVDLASSTVRFDTKAMCFCAALEIRKDKDMTFRGEGDDARKQLMWRVSCKIKGRRKIRLRRNQGKQRMARRGQAGGGQAGAGQAKEAEQRMASRGGQAEEDEQRNASRGVQAEDSKQRSASRGMQAEECRQRSASRGVHEGGEQA
jgi:hypothetical protein